jgi:anti-anti-sigma factor
MPKISHLLTSVINPFRSHRLGRSNEEFVSLRKKVFTVWKKKASLVSFSSSRITNLVSYTHYLRINKEPAFIRKKIFMIWGSMVANLSMDETEKEGIHILKVGGRLDATSAPLLERKLVHIVETPGARLVVDMKNLNYLSSAGMRVMLAASKKLKKHDGVVVFSSLQEPVMEIIKLAGFEHILQFYPTEIMALKALKTLQDKE